MIIRRKSVISGIVHEKDIAVNSKDLESFEQGYGSIQEIMPYLSEKDREFILSGITDSEWKKVFRESV